MQIRDSDGQLREVRRCGLEGAPDERDEVLQQVLAKMAAEARTVCKRCGHTYAEHPLQAATACAHKDCTCHCFWWPTPA